MTLKDFLTVEEGAVSVDWVVLTAAVVALGILIAATITPQVDAIASQLGEDMTSQLNADENMSNY